MKQTFQISGLTCEACQKLITKRIMKITGVEKVSVEPSGATEIIATKQIIKEEIQKSLEGLKYNVNYE